MDIELTSAVVGGIIAGLVVFIGIAVEHRLAQQRDTAQQQSALVSAVLGQFVSALHRNVSRGVTEQMREASLADLLSAQAQMLAFGGLKVQAALNTYDQAPQHTADLDFRAAVADLFNAVRVESLGGEPIDRKLVISMLFGA